jgi:erythromycin esterase-like protein
MSNEVYKKVIHTLNEAAEPLLGDDNDYLSLIDKIGDARFVLIGEATHGTFEFYQVRAEITRKLIEQKGFMAVAIEGDWPDAYAIHSYVQGCGDENSWDSVLHHTFNRFPTWMWRNITIPPFIRWLRSYNDQLNSTNKIGFYGLDLYSLQSSMHAVVDYLMKIDEEAASRARKRYACFQDVTFDPQTYGYLASLGVKKSCVNEAIEQLLEMQHQAFENVRKQKNSKKEEYFYAIQNARLVKNAENYYRNLFEGNELPWNVRDQHMAETVTILSEHLESIMDKPSKIIIWAHNSHVGDARATEMSERKEINLGQIIRENFSTDTYLVGFSTYRGFVTAASDWGYPAEHKQVLPAIEGSYEELFSKVKHDNFLIDLHDDDVKHVLNIPRLQRAIGVIYRPERERISHCFLSRLPYQFDHLIHFDITSAVQPLDINPEWKQY